MKSVTRLLFALLLLGWLAPAPVRAWAADITGHEIKLRATERQVKVIQFQTPGDGPRPSVLILHGAGGFDRRIADYRAYASAIANAGMDAYLVYYYSDADDADGGARFEERYPAWAHLVDDLADYLLKQKNSNGKVGLIGFSNGGILSTGAAVLDPKINAAVIYYGTEPWPLKVAVQHYPPLLILHGDADRIIPVEAGKELAQHARELGAKVDLQIYPGEQHGFGSNLTTKNGADALARTITFLSHELLGK